MNKRDRDLLLALSCCNHKNQRDLAAVCGCSLGAVNTSVKNLLKEGYIDGVLNITQKGEELICAKRPQRAVILAAGLGISAVKKAGDIPKALIEIKGETLIERIIKQLNEVGVFEIYVVVGFAKERFEFLMDKYGVELIVNMEYAHRNNLHSLFLARNHLENAYIIPSDIWFLENPFNAKELYSWYGVTDQKDITSSVRVNLKQELAEVLPKDEGNAMVGVSYLAKPQSDTVCQRLSRMDPDRRYEGSFWEETLYEQGKLIAYARVLKADGVKEINSIEDIVLLDREKVLPIRKIARALGVEGDDIVNISPLKKGLVNSSYTFECGGEKYFVRLPLDQTRPLIEYDTEAAAYKAVDGKNVADRLVYLSKEGLKISKFIDNVRLCNYENPKDVSLCMQKLRKLHNMKLSVKSGFDLFEKIEYLENLWGKEGSVYPDYKKTKENIFSLKGIIDRQEKEYCLTHMDAVWENFMISDNGEVHLIDWEYATMQDPHLDIAMFGLYAFYNKEQMEKLINAYFTEGCSKATRIKIYCYIAVAGLLWSNWCEYKIQNGTEFGEYSLRQYRYAKEYYNLVKNLVSKEEDKNA